MDAMLLLSGAVVSLIVQLIKKYAGTTPVWSLVALLLVSLVGGVGSWYLHYAGLWDSFLQIVTAAGAVYAIFIKNTESVVAGTFFGNSKLG